MPLRGEAFAQPSRYPGFHLGGVPENSPATEAAEIRGELVAGHCMIDGRGAEAGKLPDLLDPKEAPWGRGLWCRDVGIS